MSTTTICLKGCSLWRPMVRITTYSRRYSESSFSFTWIPNQGCLRFFLNSICFLSIDFTLRFSLYAAYRFSLYTLPVSTCTTGLAQQPLRATALNDDSCEVDSPFAYLMSLIGDICGDSAKQFQHFTNLFNRWSYIPLYNFACTSDGVTSNCM